MSSKKADARARIKALREEQARKDRRQERATRLGIAGAVIAAAMIIGAAVVFSDSEDGDSAALPSTVTEPGGGIVVEQADSEVTVDVWMDFLCSHCRDFEEVNGATLTSLGESGQANIVYHPLSFTGGTYSRRANNAFACSADEGKAGEFVTAAFADSQQWSDDSLVALGEDAGIGGEYESCVYADTYDGWVSDVTTEAAEAKIAETPTVFVNGEKLPSTSWTPEGITAAVDAAAAGGSVSEAPATPEPAVTQ